MEGRNDIRDMTSAYGRIEIPAVEYKGRPEVLLLELPPRYEPFMPNGLAYVSNILRGAGVSTAVLDANIIMYHRHHSRRLGLGGRGAPPRAGITDEGFCVPDDPWDNVNSHIWTREDVIRFFEPELMLVARKIIRDPPRILGVSLNGLNRHVARRVVGMIRESLPDLPVVAGGYDFVYHSSAPREFDFYDYAVIREAPVSLPPLVRGLLAGGRPRDLPGVISRHDTPGREWREAECFEDLDSLGFPKYEWADIRAYSSWEGYLCAPVTASWGCAWGRCLFCAERFKWRARSPARVADEIEWLARQGVSDIVFNDSDMNGDPRLLKDICSEIIGRKIDVSFGGQLRVDRRNDEEFFRLLRRAGCSFLRFGIDGWSDNVLRLQRKGYNMGLALENIRRSSSNGIRTSVNIVVGVPGETEEDVDECIRNLVANKDCYDRIDNINTLILAAGSEYYKSPEAHGVEFHGDKDAILAANPHAVPESLWSSSNPAIDAGTRLSRLRRICEACAANGVPFSPVARAYLRGRLGIDVPAFEEDGFDARVGAALDKIRAVGFSSVCVYGVGKHTRRLMGSGLLEARGLRVAGFIDDAAGGEGKVMFNGVVFTSAPLAMAGVLNFDCVLISSDRYEGRIYEKCAGAGMANVFRIYG